jgi:hypothetical protein
MTAPQELIEKTKAVLKIYLERGKLALAALASEDIETFYDIMDKRRIAFHNFRALDHMVQVGGVDLAQHSDVQLMWQDIKETNSLLEEISSQKIGEIEEQTSRLTKGRNISQRYGSGTLTPTRLRKFG